MSNLSIFEAIEQDRKPPQPQTRPLPPNTQRVCIDLPGEDFSCYVTKPNVEVMLRKHRDVVFDIKQGNGTSYTVEADQSDFYNARDKKLVEHKKKQKAAFKDGERLHIWISRDFKGKLILKQGKIVLGNYSPNQLDRTDYGADPITKPEPLVIAIGKLAVAAPSNGMCTKDDPFGIAGNYEAQKSLYAQWLKDMPAHGTKINHDRLLQPKEAESNEIQEYVVVTEVLAHEIQPQVRSQLERGVAVQDFPEKVFTPVTSETALVAASIKVKDALLESAWKETAGYAQEHWRNFKKLGMTVRIERKPKGKYIAVFKGKVAAKKIAGAAATQVAGVAAQKTKNAWQRAPLGSPGAAFLDGGFGRTGKAGFGGVKRIFLNSTSNFKSGMKIQVIGTVVDLWGDMTSVFGEDGSKDLTEFLGRAGVTLIKAGATAALGSLLAAGVFAATTVAAGIFGVATAPVWLVAGFVVGGYILAATLIEVIDGTVEGKERVAQWAR